MLFKSHLVSALSAGALSTALFSASLNATPVKLTVEELRIEKAHQVMPEVFTPLKSRVEHFTEQISLATSHAALMQLVIRHGNGLWQDSVKAFETLNNYDDRSLYWARLQMSKALRLAKGFQQLLVSQQQDLQWQLELLSRGQQDVKFDKNVNKKVLLTGFDPFFLDRHIDQSNPSGVTALALDDLTLHSEGQSVEIETLIVPVRFADFDQGMIEELLKPYYDKVDMIVTVSMGRDNFDLERFPGLRRSAKAPDNLNVMTGASKDNPLVPMLENKPLKGPEFVEFSLPVTQMRNAQGKFNINDNGTVTTTAQTLIAKNLSQLATATSVEGSGGGYLSNEISYRSIVLRDKLNPTLPVGHIHTPRFKGFVPQKSEDTVKQIKQMLRLAITAI